MAEIRASTPFGRTIFCDDIRQEVGGKITIIGVYSGVMFVLGEAPYHLPKFCFLVEYAEGKNANSPPIALQIFLPGDDEEQPSFSFDLPTPPNEIENDPFVEEPSYIGMRIPVVLSPFEVPSEGVIKVRMKRGDDYISLGSLAVRTAVLDELGEMAARS